MTDKLKVPASDGGTIDPDELVRAASSGVPGWSEQWGGPLGVAEAAVAAQEVLNQRSALVAGLRAAAIQHELAARSLADVAAELGVSKQAVSRASRAPILHIPTW